GSASGTQEINTLDPMHVDPQVHGILLTGGSAFGLEAAAGVRRYLERRGVGVQAGSFRVPIVPAGVIFDLPIIAKRGVRPNVAMGEAAAAAATNATVAEGSVGAGTGATVGKLYGLPRAMKGGLGTFT